MCNTLLAIRLNRPTLLILSLLFVTQSFAQKNTRSKKDDLVKSTFVSVPSDPYSFIKKQLIYEGFRLAISEQLKSMNLDDKLFWSKYEEKFTETFLPKEESIKKKYGVDDPEKKLNSVTKHRYENSLRMSKLSSKSRFGNIPKVVSSFAVKKISRSTRNPNRRYMRMNVKVNRRSLQKLYAQFVSDSFQMHYDRLIVLTDINLENGVWTDLGVSNKSVLESALNESWQKWFTNNYSNISNLIEFENAKIAMENESSKEENAAAPENQEEAEIDQKLISEATDAMSSEEKVVKELRLSVEVRIKKTFEDQLESFVGFGIKVFINVFDPATNKLIVSSDITEEPQKFSTKDVKELSSSVASAIYNLPLKKLEGLKSDVLKNKSQTHYVKVKFKHFPADLILLRSKIEEVGIGAGLDAEVVNYRPMLSEIKISHNASQEKLTAMLARVNEVKFLQDNNLIVQFNTETNAYHIEVDSGAAPKTQEVKAVNQPTTETEEVTQ